MKTDSAGELVGGIVFIALGLFLLWTATLGRNWNSTHNRAFRPVPRVSSRQERINTVGGTIGGVVVLVLGVVLIIKSR